MFIDKPAKQTQAHHTEAKWCNATEKYNRRLTINE